MASKLDLFIRTIEEHLPIIGILCLLIIISLRAAFCCCNETFSGLWLTIFGALLGILLTTLFNEYSLLAEKEKQRKKWESCKRNIFSVLKVASIKFVREFVSLKHKNDEFQKNSPSEQDDWQEKAQDVFMEEEGWIDRFLSSNAERSLVGYAESLGNVDWLKYSKALIDSDNALQLEKMFDKLISTDIEEEELINELSEFIVKKEKLCHIQRVEDFSSPRDLDGNIKWDTIKRMLLSCIRIHNKTRNYEGIICELPEYL